MVTLSPTSTVLLKVFNSLSAKEKKVFVSLVNKEMEKITSERDATSELLKDEVLMERIKNDKKGKSEEITFSFLDFEAYNKKI